MSNVRGFKTRRRTALPDAARLGTVELGCFRLKELLGRGSYGTVFLADQEGFNREAVVKIAHANLVESRDGDLVRSRFAAELQAATRVNHPNVVTLFTAGETSDGLPAIAMEYVPGAPLEDILDQRAGELPAVFVHDIFAQLGSAVAAFHRASVIHRDLSPGNVIVGDGEDGSIVVKVLDFGVAKMGEDRGRSSVVGTPRYMAPEQVVGSSGPGSDVYALGAMLWWALSGQEFQSEVRTLEDVTEARLMGAKKPADIRNLAPDIPFEVAQLLQDLLAFEISHRPSATEFCDRWAACRSALEVDSPSAKRSVTIPPPRAEQRTHRSDQLECVAFETDHVRLGVLQGFLTLHRCQIRSVEVAAISTALAPRPDVVFVSGELPGGASVSVLGRARKDAPGALLVALISTERQRTAMIRAGADYALRVPSDLPHLVEYLDEVRRGTYASDVPQTAEALPPPPPPAPPRRDPSPLMIETFMGEAPELIADIGDGISRREVDATCHACDQLRHRAMMLDTPELARLANACAAFVADGDFQTATGYMEELEQAYATVFRQLMSLHAQPGR